MLPASRGRRIQTLRAFRRAAKVDVIKERTCRELNSKGLAANTLTTNIRKKSAKIRFQIKGNLAKINGKSNKNGANWGVGGSRNRPKSLEHRLSGGSGCAKQPEDATRAPQDRPKSLTGTPQAAKCEAQGSKRRGQGCQLGSKRQPTGSKNKAQEPT